MEIRRALCILAIVLMTFLIMAPPVGAHGAGTVAVVTLYPQSSSDGPVTTKVQLVDAYRSPIPGAKVRLGVGPPGETAPPAAALTESEPGVYLGELDLPQAISGVLHVSVELQGELIGEFPVTIGPGSTPITDLPIVLTDPNDSPSATPDSPGPSEPVQKTALPPGGVSVPDSLPWQPVAILLSVLLVPPTLIFLVGRRGRIRGSGEHGGRVGNSTRKKGRKR